MTHISFSELKIWAECPFKHKLMYIDKIVKFEGNEFTAFGSRDNDDIPFGHFKFFIDSDEVTDARATIGSEYHAGFINFKWAINIGGSAVTATGRQASWSSAKTLKLQAREYGSDNEVKLNETYHWDGGASAQFHRPQIGITAIG